MNSTGKIVALCGGVGGAKLAWGLAQILAPDQLTIIGNTGDDFEHLGLHISPDLDTLMYTLAGLNNRELGWGLQGESWHCMTTLQKLGGETWFRLGDRDLATHIFRTQALQHDQSLTQVTESLCRSLGVRHRIIPMCNEAMHTVVDSDAGELAFQHYFVREQCQPAVRNVRYQQAEQATLSADVFSAINDPAVTRIIICPSNPLLSIAPILAVPGLREQLQSKRDKIVIVSPLVGGQAVKGPTAKMMREMGMALDSCSIATFYHDLVGTLVIDERDIGEADTLRRQGITVQVCRTLMKTDQDKIALARQVAAMAGRA